MGNVTKKNKSSYADMWAKATVDPKTKSAGKPLVSGKAQALIVSMGWDQTSKENDCIKAEMKCLTGPNEGRTMWRTFYIQGDDDAQTATNIEKFKNELGKLGISALKSPDEAMESLEECTVEVTLWRGKGKEDKYPVIYLNKYIKGPEETEAEVAKVEETETKVEVAEPDTPRNGIYNNNAPATALLPLTDDDDVEY